MTALHFTNMYNDSTYNIMYNVHTCMCSMYIHMYSEPGEEALYTTSPMSSLHSGMTVWHRANTLKKCRIVELLES